jgi:hypothetical protein
VQRSNRVKVIVHSFLFVARERERSCLPSMVQYNSSEDEDVMAQQCMHTTTNAGAAGTSPCPGGWRASHAPAGHQQSRTNKRSCAARQSSTQPGALCQSVDSRLLPSADLPRVQRSSMQARASIHARPDTFTSAARSFATHCGFAVLVVPGLGRERLRSSIAQC